MWSPLGTHHTFINKYMCQDSKALIISHGLRFILARMLQTCKYYFLWHPSYSNDNTQQPSLVHAMYENFFFFFYKRVLRSVTFLQTSFIDQYLLNKKNGDFGWINSQTYNIYKQRKISTTHTHGASVMRARGLMLIPIFATHFIQTRFNQARLPYGLDSCVIFYLFF